MSELKVATRYAKSLIDLAQEQKSLERVKADIDLFIQTCQVNNQLQAVLRNPIITHDKKKGILNSLFQKNVHPLMLSFFNIMVNKGRSGLLYPTAKEFLNEYNKRLGIVRALLISASPFTEKQKEQIEKTVKQSVKDTAKVILDVQTDPKLIGGFVLKVGDKQIDTTISSGLHKLKKEFAQKV